MKMQIINNIVAKNQIVKKPSDISILEFKK